ncbi:MAG: hypothetical protein ACP5RD_05970 [bacterium]
MYNISNIFGNLINNYSPIFKIIFLLKSSKFFRKVKVKSFRDSKLVLVFSDYNSYFLAIQNKKKLLNYLNNYLLSNGINQLVKEMVILNDIPKKSDLKEFKNNFIINKKYDKDLLRSIGHANYYKLILNKIRNNIVKNSIKSDKNNG